MSNLNLIIPKPEEKKEIRPGYHEEWVKRMEDRWNPPFELPNIDFHYDKDDFFNRHFSIRAARDWKNSPFWFTIASMFFIAQWGWTAIEVILYFR